MRRPLVKYATAPHLNFLIYEENLIFFFISVRHLCTIRTKGDMGVCFYLSRAAGSRVRRGAALPPPNLDGATVLLPPNLDAAAVLPSPNPGAMSDDSLPLICRPTSSGAVSCLGQPA